jgi:hypothetical protein
VEETHTDEAHLTRKRCGMYNLNAQCAAHTHPTPIHPPPHSYVSPATTKVPGHGTLPHPLSSDSSNCTRAYEPTLLPAPFPTIPRQSVEDQFVHDLHTSTLRVEADVCENSVTYKPHNTYTKPILDTAHMFHFAAIRRGAHCNTHCRAATCPPPPWW